MTKATTWLCLLVPAAVAAGTPQWRAHEITGVGFTGTPYINNLGQVSGTAGRVNKIWTLMGGAMTMPEYTANPSSEPFPGPLTPWGEMTLSDDVIPGMTQWALAWDELRGYRRFPETPGIWDVVASPPNRHGDAIVTLNQSPGRSTVWNIRDNSLRTLQGFSLSEIKDGHMSAYRLSDGKAGLIRGTDFSPLQVPPGSEQFFLGYTNELGYTMGTRNAEFGRLEVFLFDSAGALVSQSVVPFLSGWNGLTDENVLFGFEYWTSGFRPMIWSGEWGYVNPLDYTAGVQLDSQRVKVASMNSRGEMILIDLDDGREFFLEPVPEPATFASLGLGALAVLRRRKQQRGSQP